MLDPCVNPLDLSAETYLKSLPSEHSRRTQRIALELIASFVCRIPRGRRLRGHAAKVRRPMRVNVCACPWGRFRRQHVVAVRAWLAEKFSPATANVRLYALRGALKEAWRAGLMSADDLAHCLDAAKHVRGTARSVGRHLEPDELRRLFETCAADPGPLAARDAAVLGLLWGGGLRRSEVATLGLDDYDRSAGAVRVVGKGQKVRVVPLPDGSRRALDAWLQHRGPTPGALVCPLVRGGHVHPERRLVPQSIQVLVERRAAQAGLAGLKPHDGRRWTGGTLVAVADHNAAQLALGHVSPETVSRHYDLAKMRRLQAAAARVHVPYAPPRKADRCAVPA